MGTISQNLQKLIDAKNDIAAAITEKGGTVNNGDGFEEFADDIATIPSGSLPCLEFTGTKSFTLKTSAGKVWDGIIKYSTDKENWNTWDGSSTNTISSGANNKLYLRGYGNTRISYQTAGSNNSYFVFSTTGTITCTGRIDSLLDCEKVAQGEEPEMSDHCYYNLFKNNKKITTSPELPATSLAQYCYCSMFSGCTGLTSAPSLTASTLAAYCYYSMFQGCTGLTKLPTLSATTLANHCCEYMFKDCTGLTAAYGTRNATLAQYCYAHMFDGCTNLKTPTVQLYGATLPSGCYNGMFYGCTSIVIRSAAQGYTKFLQTKIPWGSYGTAADSTSVANMFYGADIPFSGGTPPLNTLLYIILD